MNISKLSIAVEIDGKPYFVLIPKDCKELAVRLISGLSEDGELKVVSAPDDYKFQALEPKTEPREDEDPRFPGSARVDAREAMYTECCKAARASI